MKQIFQSLWALALSALPAVSGAQTLNLSELANLPAQVHETSGLETSDNQTYWTHNDSGGGAELYQLSANGQILRSLSLDGVQNVDWEDIAADDQGNFFIGDFGNNNNDRRDLIIYKIPNPAGITGTSVRPDTIRFSYPEQPGFPPAAGRLHYDLEAMFWHEGKLYLFSKNRTAPFDGYTRLYRLPDAPGHYQAQLLDSFYTGAGPKELFWITGADISPDGKRMVLMSTDKLWLFTCFAGDAFFKGAVRQIQLNSASQKEAIVFDAPHRIAVSDERFFITGGKLYRGTLDPAWDQLPLQLNPAVQPGQRLESGIPWAHYRWNTGDTTSGIVITGAGLYAVTVTLNGCTATDSVRISGTSIEAPAVADAFPVSVNPNPFGPATDVTCVLSEAGRVVIEIYDAAGKRWVYLPYPMVGAGEQSFRLTPVNAELPAGNYILSITANGKRVEKNIVKY